MRYTGGAISGGVSIGQTYRADRGVAGRHLSCRRHRVFRAAGRIAAVLLPRPGRRRCRPSLQARHRRAGGGAGAVRLRLVPEQAEGRGVKGRLCTVISYLQAILLGALQGVAELFPVSSLGHTVLIPAILHWQIDTGSDTYLSFLVLTHLATALVLVVFFWRDWIKIITGVLRSLARREIAADDTYAKLGWLLIVGTIPAGILGLLFEEELKTIFASATV